MAARPPGGEHWIPQPHTGTKRHADDDFDKPSNISTQFKKLRINNGHRPVPVQHPLALPSSSHAHLHPSTPPPIAEPSTNGIHQPPPTDLPPSMPRREDFMPLDSTPHRLFITDLDAEIAAIEADESAQNDPASTFLPTQLDKQLRKIPDHLLLRPNLSSNPGNQLILYKDPSSISVPEAEDAVRKAIVEARKRTRERQAQERDRSPQTLRSAAPWLATEPRAVQQQQSPFMNGTHIVSPEHYAMDHEDEGYDPDAMDLG